MTDEEKAEEYLRCKWECGSYDRNNKRCLYKNKCIKYQIYLDGLAEGRKEKWHDLRKNPDDLPKGDEDCLCLVSECYFVGHYVKEDKEWHFDEFISSDVIAWYEFPKFEE